MAATKQKAKGKCLRGLWASERGGVVVYMALAMFFILPLLAIVINVSLVHTLNTQLQQAADAAALAAATKLDGTEAGCVAAVAAAQNAVQNFQPASPK